MRADSLGHDSTSTTLADAFIRQLLQRQKLVRESQTVANGLPSGMTASNPFQDSRDLLAAMSASVFGERDEQASTHGS